MNNFETIFGRLIRRNERADEFCMEIGISSFYEQLWSDPQVSKAVEDTKSKITKRVAYLLELLPESSILEIMRIKGAMQKVTVEFLKEATEIRINNYVAKIYSDSAEILCEEAYLNVIKFALRHGLKEPSKHLKEMVADKFDYACDAVEDCIIHYVVFPYLDWKKPKRMPQDLLDSMRKLRIEGYKAAERVLEQYEIGVILSRR